MDTLGKFELRKIIELINVISRIWAYKILHNPKALYFPPTGAGNKLPFYRDAFLLVLSRFLFKKTIFHFQASGLKDLYYKLNYVEKLIFKWAYYEPDISIIMSKRGIDDPNFIKSKEIEVIPNAVREIIFESDQKNHRAIPNLLFVGLLCKSKGVEVLIDACLILERRGIDFKLNIVGKFESIRYEKYLNDLLKQHKLENRICFKGVMLGKEKHIIFSESDIFCFPTFFEHESFPLVIIEAMMYSLPIVTTDWRSIPEIITDNKNGIVRQIMSADAIAEAISLLITDKELGIRLGTNARKDFLEFYTLDDFLLKMDNLFENV